jgi:hypothetical protein
MTEALEATTTEEVAGTETATTETTTTEATTATTGAETTTTTDDGKGKKESPWPDDWRDLIVEGAGKDADDLKKLANRYGGPAGMAKALLAAQREISTRGLAKPKPENPSDEKAMAEWRKSAGIPDDPTGYKLPDNVTKALTDEDKPVLAQFTEFAHQKGMTPDGVAIAAEWYTEMQQKAAEVQAEQDKAAVDACEDRLRAEWAGVEYKGNLNLASRFIEDHFGMPYKEFSDARLPDGRRLGDIPEFIMKLSDAGRNTFGDAVFASSDAAQKHDSRRAEIETILKTDRARYFREGLDKEYAAILQKDEKRKK